VITHRVQTGRWHSHPKLKGRFLADHPNELLVIVHEGGPRLTSRRPEVVAVEVTGFQGEVFTGRILHQPIQLHRLRLGQQIQFIVPAAARFPVLATEKYLEERSLWKIQPCKKCGFAELFDPPSELIQLLSPSSAAAANRESFKTACALCGGPQMVLAKALPRELHGTAGKKRTR
jgi:hypothetical protein